MSQIFRKWTEEEENFLINNYSTMTDEELGEKLSRTKGFRFNNRWFQMVCGRRSTFKRVFKAAY